jgi:undecaprenyl-diphosphatase
VTFTQQTRSHCDVKQVRMVNRAEINMTMAILSTLQRFDVALFDTLYSYGRERLGVTRGALAFSRSGDGYLQLLAPVFVWLLRSPLAETYLIAWAIAMLVERAAYYILKNTLKRLRPADLKPNFHSLITASDKFSFPSGHTSAAFCIATITVLIFGGLSMVMFAWALTVGISRVVVGVHFPGDVLAGALMGSGIAMGTASVLSLW